jgi:hypothetical protein
MAVTMKFDIWNIIMCNLISVLVIALVSFRENVVSSTVLFLLIVLNTQFVCISYLVFYLLFSLALCNRSLNEEISFLPILFCFHLPASWIASLSHIASCFFYCFFLMFKVFFPQIRWRFVVLSAYIL